jgi:signal transduction histidine kinase
MRAIVHLARASWAPRPFAERLPRRRRKTAWGIAAVGPLLITLGARLFGSSVPPATTLFVTLLIVVVAALIGGAGPALMAIVVGLFTQEVFFTFPYGSLTDRKPAQVSVLIVFVIIGAGIGLLVDELARLTREQAALRRIAALVARGMPAAQLFSAVAKEVSELLHADGAMIAHVEPDGFVTILAAEDRTGQDLAGERLQVEPPMAVATVVRTRQPARTDDYAHASPALKERIRRVGVRSSVATPIMVEGQLWGVIVASSRGWMLSAQSEHRMLNFTELVATAIANAESRSELAASRARIVAASDDTRRRVERDLHDGVQQRLVSLALEVRAAQSGLPPAANEVRADLSHVIEGLTGALDELREISRGIHPAILSEGGLRAALKTLARRAPIPVVLDVRVEDKLSDGVEVAAYYIISELVTNTAKHAHASTIDVAVTSANGVVHIAARDDGIGGADPARGSGLVGLRDRIETLGGTISLRSPKGEGTAVEVALPLDGDQHAGDNPYDDHPRRQPAPAAFRSRLRNAVRRQPDPGQQWQDHPPPAQPRL